jgi:hypothetical protein
MGRRTRFVIDQNGQVWDPYDERFLAALGDRDPDYDIVRYAVRHLGYVDVDLAPAGGQPPTVRYRELTVTPQALSATTQLLSQLSDVPVVIVRETDAWHSQIFPNPGAAQQWIEASLAGGQVAATLRDIQVMPQNLRALGERPLDQRLEQAEDRLALLYKKWRLTGGAFREDLPEFLIRCDLLDRTAIAGESSDQQLCWEHIGHGLNMYGDQNSDWNFELIGRPISEQPDPNYAVYVERTFRDVLEKASPSYDHVDAVIRNNQGSHRTRYNRLILPWQTSGGKGVLTTLSYKVAPDLSVQ